MNDQEIQRNNDRVELFDMGINPYPSSYYTNIYISQIINDYKEGIHVRIAGRVMSKRIMGGSSFFEIQDSKGRIQVYINRDEICQGEDKTLYNKVFKKMIDIGDIVGIDGKTFKTKTGEITIHCMSFTILTKALKPIPVIKKTKDDNGDVISHDNISDKEIIYRKRYLDFIVNPENREVFIKRRNIIKFIRNFLDNKDYTEVETPILQPIYGGASARPFKTYHNTLDIPLYLRIANELYLKRLIVGGFEGVYEFAKDFRNEGMSRYHNPEFTQLELYVSYKDYNWMMDFVEDMIKSTCFYINGDYNIKIGDNVVDFGSKWEKYSMFDIIKKYTGFDISNMNDDDLKIVCDNLNIKYDNTMGYGKLVDNIFGELCEPNIIQPTFIVDYPVEMSPLAKKSDSNPRLVERFEVICNGKELCNAYSELNDPIEQRERFVEQLGLKNRGDIEAMEIDTDFIESLEYGMPPTAGLGIGIDRLTMLLTNSNSIQDVLLFPQMKPKKN